MTNPSLDRDAPVHELSLVIDSDPAASDRFVVDVLRQVAMRPRWPARRLDVWLGMRTLLREAGIAAGLILALTWGMGRWRALPRPAATIAEAIGVPQMYLAPATDGAPRR